MLEPVARLVALAIERERFVAENAHLEALRQSEGLKTSLLRAVSHDLRSPLTAIGLSIEGLRRRLPAEAEARAALDDLARESGRLSRRIDNLLALARLEAGRSVPRSEPTPPADLFRAASEGLPLVLDAHPVHVSVAADCPDVFADPSLAAEVLVNLVENAARAAPEGTAIELTAARHPLEPRLVRLEVADRGPGIPPEGRAGAEGEHADVGRSGLGLEIARGLAAANGGHLSLHPRPGGGTIARVDLPAAMPAEGTRRDTDERLHPRRRGRPHDPQGTRRGARRGWLRGPGGPRRPPGPRALRERRPGPRPHGSRHARRRRLRA